VTEAPAPAPKRRGPSTAVKAGCSTALVFIIFALLELVARIAGGGDPNAFGGSKLQYQQIYPPLLRLVKDEKGTRFRPRDPRLVDRPTPEKAPPDRVFCFGESAVAGLGMAENASFSRALERDLRKLGEKTTVTNVGIVALDSRQVQKCVEDCCAHQKPEVVVLHVGNNEFLETHARRATSSVKNDIDDFLRAHSKLYLTLWQKAMEGKTKNLTAATFNTGSLRQSEHELIKKKGVQVEPAEIAAAVATHLANMRKTIEIAKAAGARVILMTVAVNLEWAGSKDPEGGWLAKACGSLSQKDAIEKLTKTIDDATTDPVDRWEARYARACVRRALGDMKGALEDYQTASDQDPHLRRCLAAMNENMRALAKEENVTLVDGARLLADASKDGITGFDVLYDYVHFTPEGSERLGAALAQALLGDARAPELAKLVDERRALLASRTQDALEVEEYYGWNANRAMLADRDLWKYESGRDALDYQPLGPNDTKPQGKIQAGTATPEEIVWAANASALQVGGEAHARELYAKAKAAKPELGGVIEANLRWLDAR
jgi:lysophospholipase L1-like esterase